VRSKGVKEASGATSPWISRQASRTTATARMIMPKVKCRLISVVTGVLRPICGMVQAKMNCATSKATTIQCKVFAAPP